jgi:hypothetical protein
LSCSPIGTIIENTSVTFYQESEEETEVERAGKRNSIETVCMSMIVDLGPNRTMIPARYNLMTGAAGVAGDMKAPRSWRILGREKDSDEWSLLRQHTRDNRLLDKPSCLASWSLGPKGNERPNRWSSRKKETTWRDTHVRGFRYFMILQTGCHSGADSCELVVGGLTILGTMVDSR